MNRFRSLSRGGRWLLAVVVGGATFGIATGVQASIPDANGVIHGCYNTSLAHGNPTGGLRVVDTTKPGGACAAYEAPLSWNTTGVRGPTGSVGPTGVTGPAGATGPSDGWDGVVVGDVPPGGTLTALSDGATNLASGTYLVNGQVGSDLNSAHAEVECFLELQSGTGFVPDNFSFLTVGPGDDATVPVTGTATVTAAGATVGVSCRENAGTTTVAVEGWINLTRVANLHT